MALGVLLVWPTCLNAVLGRRVGKFMFLQFMLLGFKVFRFKVLSLIVLRFIVIRLVSYMLVGSGLLLKLLMPINVALANELQDTGVPVTEHFVTEDTPVTEDIQAITDVTKAINNSKPQRVVSINLCTDQLLVYLAQRQHIASVSMLATSKLYSYVWDRIEGIHINNGLVEEILPLKPDLVLAGRHTVATTINFLKHVDLNVQQIDIPQNIDGIKQTIIQVADLLGERERGRELIDILEEKLQQAEQSLQHRPQKTGVVLAPNNFTPGTRTFKGQIIELAGFRNIAGDYGIEWYGNMKLEQIVASRPDAIILDGVTDQHQNSLAERLLQHPALRRALPHTQIINMPGNYWNCGGPTIVNAIDKLVNI